MILSQRLLTLYKKLLPCKKLADVGCDHGYIPLMALENNLCESVVVSDISQKSLNKAINALSKYMGSRAKAVTSDGLKEVDCDCDQVIIAGMGGEEIVKIISSAPFLPEIFVLQPMKNTSKVRKLLLEKGYGIISDSTYFLDEKFYDFVVASRNECTPYTQKQIKWGRDNLDGNEDFIRFLESKIKRLEENQQKDNCTLSEKIKELRQLKDETERTLQNIK